MPLSLTLTGAACSDDLRVDGQALTRLADVVPVVVGMRPDADPVGAENLCHQAIFVDDATRAGAGTHRWQVVMRSPACGTARTSRPPAR